MDEKTFSSFFLPEKKLGKRVETQQFICSKQNMDKSQRE
jgi:hypothetical protein